MGKSNFKYVLFVSVFVSCLCSACFEIVEEVNLNSDGSGSFCFTINMSQSKLDINAVLLLDSINGRPVPKIENMKEVFTQVENALKNDSSLSKIKAQKDWENYIFAFSGDFKNIEALNKAIMNVYTLIGKSSGQKLNIKDNFSYNNKNFKRLYHYNLANDYQSLPEKDKVVFKNAKYTSIYRFKSTIINYTNPAANKSKNNMSIMLKANITDIINNTQSLENSIQLN
jgi:hypothetical protein